MANMSLFFSLGITLLLLCYTKCEDILNPGDTTKIITRWNKGYNFPHSLSKRQTAESGLSASQTGTSDYIEFVWDKGVFSAYEYHLNLCTDRCLEGRFMHLNSTLGCPNIACFPCDCEMPRCEIYSTCCPDLLEVARLYKSEYRLAQSNGIDLASDYPYLFSDADLLFDTDLTSSTNEISESRDNSFENMWMQLKPSPVCEEEKVGPSYLHIRSCPRDHPNQTETIGCENDFDARDQSVVKYQHVTDNSTDVSYFNAYCAACNQVHPREVSI